jgi:hypothetical protein
MAPPKGSKFWLARTKHGRDGKFESPQVLWDACVEYFEWVENNPLWSVKPIVSNGEIVDHPISHPRIVTIRALCVFLDISSSTWYEYGKKDNFTSITKAVESIIYDIKLAGASAGLFNANIIARELGLREAGTIEHTGKDGGPIQTEEMSDRDIARRLAFTMAKGVKSDDADS